MAEVKTKKKLIEVALPLEAINKAAAREKSIRHGHPSTLHLWWARRPLAAARAVIFAQMVDDPSANPDLFPTEAKQEKERKRLFMIIEDLVLWENTTNETVLEKAHAEIWQSWRRACAENADHPQARELFDRNKLPAFHDPFAGGGALPLEAQRLGLESYASDLNPVAVLINKAMIEIPPKFAGKPPVNPESRGNKELFARKWKGAQGLAEDVRYYGQWMRDEAEKRIGHLYPKVEITKEMARDRPDLKPLVGQELTVIAWIWARTVKSPNPAFRKVDVPLASTFMLSTKEGKEAYVDPAIEGNEYTFKVRVGKPKSRDKAEAGTSAGKRSGFKCIMSDVPLTYEYIRKEGSEGRLGSRLMAIVAEGGKGRVYISPVQEHEEVAEKAKPSWQPDTPLYGKCRVNVSNYGMDVYGDLFTSRQLVALTTFSDLVGEAMIKIEQDALNAGLADDHKPLRDGGTGAKAYGQAVGVYLSFAMDKVADRGCTLGRWDPSPTQSGIINAFSRQALPMTWDYAEANPLGAASGNLVGAIELVAKALVISETKVPGNVHQADAAIQSISLHKVISTDPPYYDNIGYADLSDFFYVWMRRSLRNIFPDLFGTMTVPKDEELVATPYRHGNKEKAEEFFLNGMTRAMHILSEQGHQAFPLSIYYAFKQSETESDEGTSSTGWETFLDAVIRSGLSITGTWPMRTELSNRMIGSGTNALASSIVLVCRSRQKEAPSATRREFMTALQKELPIALRHLQAGNIAPVDLAQASIGPGISIFTRYSKVLDAKGEPLTVREALTLINQVLDETLAAQEGDFDPESRWAVSWFEQHGFGSGDFGTADVLARAKNTAVNGLDDAGIIESGKGKVRLLKPKEMDEDWDPDNYETFTAWEIAHQLIRSLESKGEAEAAAHVRKLGAKADVARELAYRLYTICERKKRAEEARSYNGLVQSWPEIQRLAHEKGKPVEEQGSLFGQ